MKTIILVLTTTLLLAACSPKVGSPEWCEKMEAKDKGEWTLNDAKDYARYCIMR